MLEKNNDISNIIVDNVWDLPLKDLVSRYLVGKYKELCEKYMNLRTGSLMELDLDENYVIYQAFLKNDNAFLVGIILICLKDKYKSRAKITHSSFKLNAINDLKEHFFSHFY